VAEVLLHADVRPDDRLLVVGYECPWNAAWLNGTIVIHTSAADVLGTVAEAHATVLVCPAQALAEMAFRRPHRRPDLASLRTIIATGGPLSPEGRRRIYTWVKPDIMLLARTGDTFWGNPLEPVLARPPATPAFPTLPASTPLPR
jgi:acyl-coenzyme A synthetase/AMP-(fatty) acid ligase